MAVELEVKGYYQLAKQLDELEAKAGQRVVAGIMSRATTPLKAAWRAKAPVRRSKNLKKTYKGRYVAPGFLKRSITSKRVTRKLRKAVALVVAGVADEAFYGPQFLDDGKTVTGRRPRGKGQIRKAVKPYTLPAYDWYFSTYKANLPGMVKRIAAEMEKEIGRI